jgi:hypothetical protein
MPYYRLQVESNDNTLALDSYYIFIKGILSNGISK